MTLGIPDTLEIIEVMENFLSRKRPADEIRDKLDIGYEIENQSVVIFEIRPQWNKPEVIIHVPIAKTTFVKAKNHWKVFWMRSDLKWHTYTPKPTVKRLSQFTKLVEDDAHYCFFG